MIINSRGVAPLELTAKSIIKHYGRMINYLTSIVSSSYSYVTSVFPGYGSTDDRGGGL